MGIRGGGHRLVKGIKDQSIVIRIPDDEGYDAPVVEIQNGAEIDLVFLCSYVILELCHVSQPFLVWLVRMKFPFQNILCQILWIGSLPCTAVVAVLDGGFNPFGTADPQHSLIVYRCIVEPFQIIPYPPVSLVRLLTMDLLYYVRNTLILCCSLAPVAGLPLVICCPGHPKDPALCVDGMVKFLVAIPNRTVLALLSYLSQRSLPSNSFTFFNRSRSILVMYSSCSS